MGPDIEGQIEPIFVIDPEPDTARLEDTPLPTDDDAAVPVGNPIGDILSVQAVRPSSAHDPERYAGGIVSQLYARQVYLTHGDGIILYYPDRLVRNREGTVIGCRRLGRYMSE